MGFKHTGLFPEQAVNWDYMIDKIKNSNNNKRAENQRIHHKPAGFE